MPVARNPAQLSINPVTNKIYVTHQTGKTITVIDGATNALTTVATADDLGFRVLAVNPVTNRIYSASASNNVTVIDGATNAVTPVAVGGPYLSRRPTR